MMKHWERLGRCGLLFFFVSVLNCAIVRADETTANQESKSMKVATFGGGCFWCTEAVFQRLNGVTKIVSGYSGGHVKEPTYKQVCEGKTGHAEVIQVSYDPAIVEFKELLEVFWKTHDPTTLNKQGADEGPQYRSVIFYHDDEQKELAELYKKKLDASKYFRSPIVTEIAPFTLLYPAEDYHQNYFNDNPANRYCQFVVASKVAKFREIFGTKAKDEATVRNGN
jgi:peptide-methionine (S)-S-oxide reductase